MVESEDVIVQCNECDSRFNIEDKLIGPKGRKMKCSKCGHIFFQGPADATPPAPEPVDVPSPAHAENQTPPTSDASGFETDEEEPSGNESQDENPEEQNATEDASEEDNLEEDWPDFQEEPDFEAALAEAADEKSVPPSMPDRDASFPDEAEEGDDDDALRGLGLDPEEAAALEAGFAGEKSNDGFLSDDDLNMPEWDEDDLGIDAAAPDSAPPDAMLDDLSEELPDDSVLSQLASLGEEYGDEAEPEEDMNDPALHPMAAEATFLGTPPQPTSPLPEEEEDEGFPQADDGQEAWGTGDDDLSEVDESLFDDAPLANDIDESIPEDLEGGLLDDELIGDFSEDNDVPDLDEVVTVLASKQKNKVAVDDNEDRPTSLSTDEEEAIGNLGFHTGDELSEDEENAIGNLGFHADVGVDDAHETHILPPTHTGVMEEQGWNDEPFDDEEEEENVDESMATPPRWPWAVAAMLFVTLMGGFLLQTSWWEYKSYEWSHAFRLDSVDGQWRGIQGGSLLVVNGALENITPHSQAPSLVRVSLMDDTNKALASSAVIPGRILSEEDLKAQEGTLRKLISLQTNVKSSRIQKIPPKRSESFQALFINPPQGAVRFQIDLEPLPADAQITRSRGGSTKR
jgi:predicted Zn finger-like uncharacterized protein